MRVDEHIVAQARAADMAAFLEKRNGFTFAHRGNVVFVGHDEYGKPRFASLRGTHGDFRGDCSGSDKRYG